MSEMATLAKEHATLIVAAVAKRFTSYCEPYDTASLFWLIASVKMHNNLRLSMTINDHDERIYRFFRLAKDINRFETLKHAFNKCLVKTKENQKLSGEEYQAATSISDIIANYKSVMREYRPLWECSIEDFSHILCSAQVDCIDPLQFVEYWATDKTLFFVDPPRKHRAYSKLEHLFEMADALTQTEAGAVFRVNSQPLRERLLRLGWKEIANDLLANELADSVIRYAKESTSFLALRWW